MQHKVSLGTSARASWYSNEFWCRRAAKKFLFSCQSTLLRLGTQRRVVLDPRRPQPVDGMVPHLYEAEYEYFKN